MQGDKVECLDGQESYIIKSFSEANCLIYVQAGSGNVKKGSKVEVHIL